MDLAAGEGEVDLGERLDGTEVPGDAGHVDGAGLHRRRPTVVHVTYSIPLDVTCR
jgi:hypothetical protein